MYEKVISAQLSELRKRQTLFASKEYAGKVRMETRANIHDMMISHHDQAMAAEKLIENIEFEEGEVADRDTIPQIEAATILSMPFGDITVRLMADGECMTSTKLDAKGWHRDVKMKDMPRGCATTNKVLDNGVRIPAGVLLIIGGASKSKTPMAHLLASSNCEEYAVVPFGEPLSGYQISAEEAGEALARALAAESDILVDSVKDLLASAKGGAMKAGVARGAFPMLSSLSTLAADVGATIYAPINPSSEDDELMKAIESAAASNVISVVVATPSGWACSMRRGEGLIRDTFMVQTAFADDLLLHFAGDTSSAGTNGKDVKMSTVVPMDDRAFNAVIRRSFIQ